MKQYLAYFQRERLKKICKNKGLYRVQKSIFLGSLNKNQKDELKIMMERIVNEDTDSIYIFPSTTELLEMDLMRSW